MAVGEVLLLLCLTVFECINCNVNFSDKNEVLDRSTVLYSKNIPAVHVRQKRQSEDWLHITSNSTVFESEPFVLSCLPKSDVLFVRWLKKNHTLGQNSLGEGVKWLGSTSLSIHRMRAEHFGKYTCLATTFSGMTLMGHIMVRKGTPRSSCQIYWNHVPVDSILFERTSYHILKCTSPTNGVTITWEKDGKPIIMNRRIKLMTTGQLTIDKPLPEDEGLYGCLAKTDKCQRKALAYIRINRTSHINESCNLKLTSPTGTIKSPSFPLNYPDDMDCFYHIQLSPGSQIYLSFLNLSLEHSETCNLDFVKVYDGPTFSSPLLGSFCDHPEAISIQSSSNDLLLHFRSDPSVGFSGFRAVYSSTGFDERPHQKGACHWKHFKSNGEITSPNYPKPYHSKHYCHIDLEMDQSSKIVLYIEFMELRAGDDICEDDFIEIINSDQLGNNEYTTYCGVYDPKQHPKIISNTNKLTFKFRSKGDVSSKGFIIKYFQVSSKKETPYSEPETENVKENFLSHPVSAKITSGQRHTLKCKGKSSGSIVRWYKEHLLLLDESDMKTVPLHGISFENPNELTIEEMSPSVEGVYMCKILSSVGKFHTKAIISVEYHAENQCSHGASLSRNLTLNEGIKGVNIKCNSHKGSDEVYWTKNGKNLTYLEGYEQLKDGSLEISQVGLQDFGVFACMGVKGPCAHTSTIIVTVLKRRPVCGMPRIQPTTTKPLKQDHKIVGGLKAERGSFPWQGALFNIRDGIPKARFFCGCSLITKRFVLTAAHCFQTLQILDSEVLVRFGKHNISSQNEPGQQEFRILKSFHHEQYNSPKYNNDISLVYLDRDVEFTYLVLPICLGNPRMIEEEVFIRRRVAGTVSGWGRLYEGGGYPSILQEITLPIQPEKICKDSAPNYIITTSMFCAGYREEIINAIGVKGDACQGDSGGPFAIKVHEIWYVVGIVSFGEGCGRVDKYGFYTKVNQYYEWMTNILNENL